MNGDRFHEWPLVVFTTLAVMGAGLLTAPLVAALVGPAAAAAWAVVPAGTALIAAGLLVSLAHLGQPQRSPLALARLGRSRLSNEVLLASAAVGAGSFAAVLPHFSPATAILPSFCAIAFLVSLGLVYALPGQLAWRGAAAATPLVLGLGFGALALSASRGASVTAVAPVAAAALAADIGLLLWSRKAGALRHQAGALRHEDEALRRGAGAPWDDVWGTAPALPVSPRLLLAARLLLVDILPGCLLLAGLSKGAAGLLGFGILVDRLSFYLLARQHTTEAEIARVEGVIAGRIPD